MAKRKVIRRVNKTLNMSPINLRTKKYDIGGSIFLGNTVTDISNSPIDTSKLTGLTPKAGLGDLLGAMGPLMMVNALGGATSAIGSGIGSAISGGKSSGAGNVIDTIGDTSGSIPIVGGFIKGATGIVSGITNSLFGSKLNKENISKIEGENKALNTLMVDNSSNDSILNQWSNQDFGSSFSRKDIGSDGLFSNKAKKKYRALKKQQGIARNRALTAFENAADTADTQSDLNAMASFAAFGGPLGIWGGYGSGAIGYELAKESLGIKALNAANKGRLTSLPNSFGSELNTFADGGKIYIKPENRGKFTALKERTGKSATWFKEHGTPTQKKMATFALNARKWKHEDGGPIKKKTFEDWYKTIPADRNDTTSYNLRRAYELAPYDELEAWRTSSIKDLKEGKNHLRSVYLNPNTGVYEFMKSKNHPTLHFETDWYNSNDPEAVKFRKDYDLDMSGDYYKYVPKKKAFGGDLLTHGAEWDNGLRVIGNGGTHEENPMEGVPMGMDAEGNPNLVEQGEVIFNDYVFSNRLFADGGLLESVNLPKTYDGYSFAAIAERLGSESKERPNDPISKRGLLSSMSRLQQAQETVRQQTQEGQEGVQYAHGGRMGTLFDGLGNKSNNLKRANFFLEPTEDNYSYNPFIDIAYTDPDKYTYGIYKYKVGITPNGEFVETPKYMARAAAKRAGYDVGNSLDDYNKNPIKVSEKKKKSAVSRLLSNLDDTDLRYAPVVGAAIGLGQNLFSRPDYTSADAILEAANQAGNYTPIGYTPIGNYLQYRPFDRNFYLNKLNAQAGATRRAIMNTTSPSRNAALLAADYNAQGRLGDLARQAEEYNLAQRQAVETFNRGTNISNAEMGLKAAMANQEAALKARSSRLSGVAQAMAVRDAVDARRGASMSANLTNLFDSLGNIGIDEMNRADRDMLIRAGVFGTLSEKPQGWSNKRWEDYKKAISGKGYSRGGKLKKRRGGLTY